MALTGFADHFRAAFPDLLGNKVLVALSGGPDSVALLHLLAEEDLHLEIEAAHVHHGVRGIEADNDAAFCETLCLERGVPFHTSRIQATGPLEDGREGTWRKLRYDALLDLKKSLAAVAVATGHHRDDVAEGVLVQLLRGGGPRALAGIAQQTSRGVARPLLPWSRREIVDYLTERRIAWREDSSNSDLDFLRNRVRHKALPELEKMSPSLRDHLVHLANALASSEAYLATEVAARAGWIDPWEPEGGVAVETISGLAPPLRARWLHAQARRVGLARVTRAQLALFEGLIRDGEPRAVTLGGRWAIRQARGRLWLEPPLLPEEYAINLSRGETIDLPLKGWSVGIRDGGAPEETVRWSLTVSRGSVVTVRSPRTDDQISVSGGTITLSNILAQKLPRHLRRSWPVCCEDDKIYWIPGVWRDPVRLYSEGPVLEVMRRERPASNLQR